LCALDSRGCVSAKLDDEIAGEVLGRDFAALFPPQPQEGGFIIAHNDPGIRAADEVTTSARQNVHSRSR
jgi:hypothetical protein